LKIQPKTVIQTLAERLREHANDRAGSKAKRVIFQESLLPIAIKIIAGYVNNTGIRA
jgi:hypothetical protein